MISTCDIWKFIDFLKEEKRLNRIKIEQSVSGAHQQHLKTKYKEVAVHIELIVDYKNRSTLDYLRGIAYDFLVLEERYVF